MRGFEIQSEVAIRFFIFGNRMNQQPRDEHVVVETSAAIGILGVMAAREFDDWSPASVFGSTEPTPRSQKTEEPSTPERASPREDNNSSLDQELPSKPSRRSQSVAINAFARKSTRPEVSVEEPTFEDEDYAARVIHSRFRVWLLYKREAESIAQVQQLRLELESAAAVAIVDWLRRCCVRYGLVERAGQLRYERAVRRDAHEFIGQWTRQRQDVTRFRAMLRRRIHARRKLSCWLRRIQCERRCQRRRKLREESLVLARETAQRLILRVVWTYIKHRRRMKQVHSHASECIRVFTLSSMLRIRAKAEAERRRRCRAASLKIHQTHNRWKLRLGLAQWRLTVQQERDAEVARHHHAACVLQRLIRVMLTAFRLMRRRDAASKIQSVVRGRQTRQRYRIRLRERRHAAATTIQRRVRGVLARKLVNRMLQQLRERFKCLNCGLIEPGGLYCKFCGRRRTTFDVLGPGIAAGLTTTDAKLRKKRKSKLTADTSAAAPLVLLPPAPPLAFTRPSHGKRQAHPLAITTGVLTMDLPDAMPPSPAKTTNSMSSPSVLLSPRFTPTQISSPVQRPSYPRKPPGASHNGIRPSHFHRSVSTTEAAMLPLAGLVSVDKTRQRAEALMQHDNSRFQQHSQSTMNLHMQRLQKGGKAASR